ncbi:MAG: S-methyl-5-thioribose-1-phosphate isomerase [Candidatus Jordarchaeaceae archaeon]
MKVKVNGKTISCRNVWMENGTVNMIDQTRLPFEFRIHKTKSYRETAEAIRRMQIRGAPAIGVAASYGLAQAALEFKDLETKDFWGKIETAAQEFLNTRPTAVDMHNMVARMLTAMKKAETPKQCVEIAFNESQRIAEENIEACKNIGLLGRNLIKEGDGVLTHCNTGALGTVDYGTALSIIRFAHYQDKDFYVLVTETRPWLQGRLTSWELMQEGIKHYIVTDNAAGYYMKRGEVQIVLVGADRILSNGDVINKIGTYTLATLAYENKIPFVVAAPTTSIDLNQKTENIIIEERDPKEITYVKGYDEEKKTFQVVKLYAADQAKNPVFDITPAKYVSKIVTEKQVIEPPYNLKKQLIK